MKYFSEKALEKKIEAIGGGGKTYSAGAGLDLNDTVFSIEDSVLAEIAKISDWFELKDGNIHVKGNRGFWSDSFISAGGLSSGGGAAAGNATLSNVTTTGATISADGVGSIDVYSKGYLDTALAQAGKVQSVVGQTGAVTAAQIGSALISEGYELTDHTYTNGTGLSLVGGEFSISTGYQTKIQSGEDAYTDLHNWFERINIGTEANPVWVIHVKSEMGFYGDSFISAGGLSTGGGASAGNATLVAQTYGGTLSATGIDPIKFYSKERVDQLLATAGTVQTVAGVSPVNSDIPLVGLTAALAVGSVVSGNTGLVTGGSVYSAINEAVSSVMKMQGTTTTPISDGSTTNPVVIDGSSYTAKKGDVVLYDGKEYLWTSSAWEQLGDEASWALKTTTISVGTGLIGGGSLASNRTISLSDSTIASLALANTALQSVAFSDLTSHPTTLSGYAISDAKIDGGVITLGNNTITPVTGVAVGGSGHTNELAITSGGTTTHITVPFATSATTASKLSTVSKTIWGVTYWTSGGVPTNVTGRPTLYIARTQVNTSAANDTLLGITAISNAASSGSSDKSRMVWDADHDAWHFLGNVYADGFISAGGLSSGGGAEGVSLAAVWASLKTNSDDYANEKINAYHIPIGSGLSVVNGLIVANNAGAVTSVKVGTTTYNPTDGVVSLPAYPTIPANVSAFTNDAGYLTAHQSLAGYVNALTRTPASGGNYVSAVTKSGKTITVTYGTLPTSLPASDVYAWAKAETKPSYAFSEITGTASTSQIPTLAISKISGLQNALDGKQPLDDDLSKIAAIDNGIGLLKRSVSNNVVSWTIDTNAYITGITSAMVTTALGYTPVNVTALTDYQPLISDLSTIRSNASEGHTAYGYFANGVLPYNHGGTGRSSAWTANSVIYASSTSVLGQVTNVSGNNQKKFLVQTTNGSGVVSAPSWAVIASTDLPAMYIGRTAVTFSAANATLLGIDAISNAASSGSTDKSRIVWDADHEAWHFIGNVYADGFVSAGGLSDGGGTSGIDEAAMWQLLGTTISEKVISASHIPDLAYLSGDLTVSRISDIETWISGKGYLTAHQSLDGYVNALTRTPSSGGNYVSAVTKSGKTLTVTYATLPTALKNPNALTFGSKTYDGSAARTITASDLGALTAHQTVTLASGTNNGTLKLTTAAGVTDNIAVTGLKALAYKSSLAFSELTGTPTTLSGYGISDAMRVIVLEDNGTTTAGTWLAKSNPSSLITGYTDGLVVLYKITVAGASTTTLNINGIGAKTVYRVGTSKLTTHYPVGSYILLYYAAGIGSGSFQVLTDYDSNSDTKLRQYVTESDVEYPLLARYNTTSGAAYYDEYGRYAAGVTLNPHEKSITASKFIVTGGASSGFLKADGSVDSNSYALASAFGGYYTKSETDAQISAAIDALPEPMIFKGSLGTGGTITTLPAASSANEGFTYKVITAGTYQSIAAKVGDTFISTGSAWVLIPSGDEPSGTVTSVGLSVPTGLSVSGSPITTSGTFKISFAAGYSIPTTTKQTAWDAKYDKPSTGIPQTDLASALSTKVNHGESAYNSLNDWFEVVDGNIHVKGNRGFYSDSFISAGGLSSSGGSGGIDPEAMWQLLGDSTNEQIAASHLTAALNGYVNSLVNSGTGNYVSALSKSGNTITATYGTLPTSLPASDVYAWAKKASLAASDVPTLAISKISGLQTALDGKQPLDADLTAIAALTGGGLLRRNTDNTWGLDTNAYVTSSGVTSVATGTGLTGGTITSTGTISINSTYQTYISHGNTAYGWGNHASKGYLLASTAASTYLPLAGGTMSNTNLVTNLNADLLDGQHGSYYNNLLTFYDSGATSADNVTYPLSLLNIGTPSSAWWYVTTMYYAAVGSTAASQIATSYSASEPQMYIRQKNGTWTSWQEVYHSGNLTKSVLTGLLDASGGYYLPLTGGTMSNTNVVTNLNADLLDGYHVSVGDNSPYETIPVITAGGWMDVGKHFEFHYDNTTGSDYSTILQCTGNYSNVVNLPSGTGTLALTTDNVASATKLQTSRTLWGQSFDGTADVTGSLNYVNAIYFQDISADRAFVANYYNGGLYAVLYDHYANGNISLSACGGGLYYGYYNTTGHYFYTGGTEKARMDSSGNIGIGTPSPGYLVDINGDAKVTNLIVGPTYGKIHMRKVANQSMYDSGIYYDYGGHEGLLFCTGYSYARIMFCPGVSLTGASWNNSSAMMVVTTTGVGVNLGTGLPSYALDVSGVIHASTGIYTEGYVSAGATSSSSDERLKSGIKDFGYDPEMLMALRPREWDWNNKSYMKGHAAGVVAQELQRVMPYAIVERQYLSVNYDMLHAVEIAGLQDHERRIAELEKENRELKRRLNMN